MSTTYKVKSKTTFLFVCNCGKRITYRATKSHEKDPANYESYAMTWLGAWRMDNHYYKCEEQQNES